MRSPVREVRRGGLAAAPQPFQRYQENLAPMRTSRGVWMASGDR